MLGLVLAACGPVGFREAEWHAEPLRQGRLTWRARDGQGHGPGLGRWSRANVRRSGEGLELRLRRGVGAEVSAELPLGYVGLDVVLESLDAPFEALDPEVVVGAFVYRHDDSEVDLEVARWGDPRAPNGQLVVAAGPGRAPRSLFRFPLRGHRIDASLRWRGTRLVWRVADQERRRRWTARGPRNAGHRLHVNVWARRNVAGTARVRLTARVAASARLEAPVMQAL